MKPSQIFNRLYRALKITKIVEVRKVQKKNLSSNFPYFKNKSFSFEKREFSFFQKNLRLDVDGLKNLERFEKLWRYNLYYFDFLNSCDSNEFNDEKRDLVHLFIRKYKKTDVDHEFFDPYPMSLRIVNLIKWVVNEGINDQKINDFIYYQAEILKHRIEYHLLCNHYFANLKALIFSSIFFDQDSNEYFFNRILKELDDQLDEQFLSDGAHFEGSPMYHSILLEDILDIFNLFESNQGTFSNIEKIRNKIKGIIPLSLEWLEKMTHPNGELSFFNDSSLGVALSLDNIRKYSIRLGFVNDSREKNISPNNILLTGKESGYSVCENKNFYIIFDVADISPSYNPGHCHADTLSFELSLFNHKIFVNRGTSTYNNSTERHIIRSTISHNTVVVDERNSSNVWSSFRVGNRAKIIERVCERKDQKIIMAGQHDGFSQFLKKIIHKRKINFDVDVIEIQDEVIGNFNESQSNFLVHPEVELQQIDKKNIELSFFERKLIVSSENELEISPAIYSPYFNQDIETKRISINFKEIQKTTLKIIP